MLNAIFFQTYNHFLNFAKAGAYFFGQSLLIIFCNFTESEK
jgi:hypothetical protein